MRGTGGLIWALLVGGIVLGGMALMMNQLGIFGANGPDQTAQYIEGARDLDSAVQSHLSDLGVKFAPTDSREPTLNLEKPTEEDFAFLEKILSQNDAKSRFSAASVLRDIGAPRSVDPLLGSVRGVDPRLDGHMVECALTILADKSPEQYREVLIPAFERHRETLGDDVAALIRAKLRDAGATDAAFLRESAVSDREPLVRRFAIAELAADKKPPLGVLAAAMADPDPAVRKDATDAMAVFHR